MAHIRRANLEVALTIAIRTLAEQEKRYGPNFKSIQRAGFEAVLAELKRGQPVEVIE